MTMNGDFNIAFVADIDEAHYMDFWVLMRPYFPTTVESVRRLLQTRRQAGTPITDGERQAIQTILEQERPVTRRHHTGRLSPIDDVVVVLRAIMLETFVTRQLTWRNFEALYSTLLRAKSVVYSMAIASAPEISNARHLVTRGANSALRAVELPFQDEEQMLEVFYSFLTRINGWIREFTTNHPSGYDSFLAYEQTPTVQSASGLEYRVGMAILETIQPDMLTRPLTVDLKYFKNSAGMVSIRLPVKGESHDSTDVKPVGLAHPMVKKRLTTVSDTFMLPETEEGEGNYGLASRAEVRDVYEMSWVRRVVRHEIENSPAHSPPPARPSSIPPLFSAPSPTALDLRLSSLPSPSRRSPPQLSPHHPSSNYDGAGQNTTGTQTRHGGIKNEPESPVAADRGILDLDSMQNRSLRMRNDDAGEGPSGLQSRSTPSRPSYLYWDDSDSDDDPFKSPPQRVPTGSCRPLHLYSDDSDSDDDPFRSRAQRVPSARRRNTDRERRPRSPYDNDF
nr:protein UL0 [Gallid alphaherpesvirus 1]